MPLDASPEPPFGLPPRGWEPSPVATLNRVATPMGYTGGLWRMVIAAGEGNRWNSHAVAKVWVCLPDTAAVWAMLDSYDAGWCDRRVLADFIAETATNSDTGERAAAALRG